MKIEEMNIRLQIKRIKKKFCNFFKIVHIRDCEKKSVNKILL